MGKSETCGCCLAKVRVHSRGEVILGDKREKFEDSRIWEELTVRRAYGERKQFGAVAKGCGMLSTADYLRNSVNAGNLVLTGHLHTH